MARRGLGQQCVHTARYKTISVGDGLLDYTDAEKLQLEQGM